MDTQGAILHGMMASGDYLGLKGEGQAEDGR